MAKNKRVNYSSLYKQKALQWKEYAMSLEKLVDSCLEDLKNISQRRVLTDSNRNMSSTEQFAEYAATRLKSKVNFRSAKPKHDYRKGV